MIKSLAGVNPKELRYGNIDGEIWKAYGKEVKNIQDCFFRSKESFKLFPTSKSFQLNIPKKRFCQRRIAMKQIRFDQTSCKVLNKGHKREKKYLTVYNGGTCLIALHSILQYYQKEVSLLQLGKKIVKRKMRINGAGVHHMAMDTILELEYDIKSKMLSNATEILQSLFTDKPVLCLVPVKKFQRGLSHKGNQAVLIWGLKEDKFVVTDTVSSIRVQYINAKELIDMTIKAWSFEPIRTFD